MFKKEILGVLVATSILTPIAWGAVSAEEAEKLQAELTPVGAQRKGNIDGTIPEWQGGLTQALPGWPNKNNHRPNPYSDDEILFTITAANYKKHTDKLTPGTVALFETYPDDFKMEVYPTRRTAAFTDHFYSATAQNAISASITDNGVKGANGGVPFPIPKSGTEVIWNYLLSNPNTTLRFATVQEANIFNNGQRQAWTYDLTNYSPFQDRDRQSDDEGVLVKTALTFSQPARDAGEGVLIIDSTNPAAEPRKAWTYDPGERRVRRAPSLKFDTPDRALNVIDDYDVYSGSPERYDWKLIGKKEIYVPYNNNELNSPNNKLNNVAQVPYLNPDLIRYELHRVWVVEGILKEGQRHLYQKRVKYLDEDSWRILSNERYDGTGELWRIGFSYPVFAPEIPVVSAGTNTSIDLKKGGYYVNALPAEGVGFSFEGEVPKASYFTSSALRRRGR